MKRTPLLLAALVPFVATAGAAPSTSNQKVNHQDLRDDLQVTALLGADVQGDDDSNVGAIEDVVLDREGNIVSVIVQREGDVQGTLEEAGQTTEEGLVSAERTAEDTWSDVTSERDRPTRDTVADSNERGGQDGMEDASGDDNQRADGMAPDPDRAGATEMGDTFVKVDWKSLSVDRKAETVRLTQSATSLQTVQYDQTEPLQGQGEVRASNLVGMEVNLADEDSFGEVEDVLIDATSGKATAIVVDSMEFFDKERYALPVDLGDVNLEEEELTLQHTQQEIDAMEEFDMDEGDADDAMEDDADDSMQEDTARM